MAYKGFLAGVGAGLLGCSLYVHASIPGRYPPAPKQEKSIKSYKTTESIISNHADRKGLSFFEKRYFFNEGEISEMTFCFPKKGVEKDEDCLMFVIKSKKSTEESPRPRSKCAECHPRYQKRLPLDPNDPLESG